MKVLCEISVRHLHLSPAHLETLFGVGHKLTSTRELSQPGQFLCAERVDLVTPKATFENVAIIGPTRNRTQVELSRTDCFALGLKNVPVRQSDEHEGSVGIIIRRGDKEVVLESGVIIAKRHVHLDPRTASEFKLKDGQIVSVNLDTERGGTLDHVVVRVKDSFRPAVHIDTDEGNALGFGTGEVTIVVK
jgi:propanediol utilization protein